MVDPFAYPEGATPIDPNEREGLKHKHITTRAELDHLEQANIEEGLRWLSRARNIDVLDISFLMTLHKQLFGEVWKWAGQFRTTGKNIGVEPSQIAIELRNLLDDVPYWIENETYPSLEIAIRFHHRLVKIHLFPNGNGRHARIATDLLTSRVLDAGAIDWAAGYDLQQFSDRRSEYIAALRAADGHDYGPLFSFANYDHE
jgi:Fic-DOC domain mobile mystery protein B